MKKQFTAQLGLIGILAIGFMPNFGCQQEKTEQSATTQPTSEPTRSNSGTRLQVLRARLTVLDRQSDPLPGQGDSNHRKIMSGVFTDYVQILLLLEAPDRTNEFEQQTRIIESSARELSNGSMELAADPIIDNGMRALYRALEHITRDEFGNAEPLTTNLADLRQTIDGLDVERGSLHRVQAAVAVRAANRQIHLLTEELAIRIGEGQPAATIFGSSQPAP